MNIGYVTLLATPEYLTGVAAMITSLQNTNTKIPIYCIVTPNISEDIQKWLVDNFNISIIKKDFIECPARVQEYITSVDPNKTNYIYSFNKIHIFDLTQFDKIVYLDADLFIAANIDNLFMRPHLSAVLDKMLIDSDEMEGCNILNSGLMVIEPNHSLFQEALDFVENLQSNQLWNDRLLFAKLFPNWSEKRDNKLPLEYNVQVSNLDQYFQYIWFNPLNVKVWHFNNEKPWLVNQSQYDNFTTSKKQLFIEYLKVVQAIQGTIDNKQKE